MVKLLYFMKLAERIGCTQEELALPQSVSSMGICCYGWGSAVNKKFVDSASPVRDGDEIAFSPKGR